MFSKDDIKAIEERGSSVKTIEAQVERFKKGFPWMDIVGPATPERGIKVMDEEEADRAVAYCDNAAVSGKCKFVPASGAASRMFKDIFAGLSALENGTDPGADRVPLPAEVLRAGRGIHRHQGLNKSPVSGAWAVPAPRILFVAPLSQSRQTLTERVSKL